MRLSVNVIVDSTKNTNDCSSKAIPLRPKKLQDRVGLDVSVGIQRVFPLLADLGTDFKFSSSLRSHFLKIYFRIVRKAREGALVARVVPACSQDCGRLESKLACSQFNDWKIVVHRLYALLAGFKRLAGYHAARRRPVKAVSGFARLRTRRTKAESTPPCLRYNR